MSYYIAKTVGGSFEEAVHSVIASLEDEGFGILSDIDVKATMKKKLNEEFKNYRILGACNPPFALKALLSEDKIGTMLPCNVIIQELADGRIEVAAINPVSSMKAVGNPTLLSIASEIRDRLSRVIEKVS